MPNLNITNANLPPYLEEQARKELHETPEKRIHFIKDVRDYVENCVKVTDPSIKIRTDDEFLLRFIRISKYDLDKAFDRVKRYYEDRVRYKSDYEKLSWKKFDQITNDGIFEIVPEKTKDHRIVMVVHCGKIDSKYSMQDIICSFIQYCEMMVDLPEFQISGIVAVFDYKGFSLWKSFKVFTPFNLIKFVRICLFFIPFRINQIHVINMMPIVHGFVNIIRPLLIDKIKKRLFTHSTDLRDFYRAIDSHILPPSLGGTGPSMMPSDVIALVESIMAKSITDLKSRNE